MARTTTVATLDAAGIDRVLTPRADIVHEHAQPADRPPTHRVPSNGPGGDTVRFGLDHGPFAHYERTVVVEGADDDGHRTVTQHFAWKLPQGCWPFLVHPPLRRALRAPRADGRLPWWYPPQRPDAHGAMVLGLLATLSLIVGYHGTLLGQTMTFAADEFGNDTTAQGAALSAARVGGFLAIGLGAIADRRGRRLILLLSLLLSIGATVVGAFAPNLAVLAATQTVSRGASVAAGLLVAVVMAEEMPKGARAYAAGLLGMASALGAGIALWVLPVADVGERAWRVLYLVPLAFLPLLARYGRLLPESRRYVRPHRDVRLGGHTGQLLLLATAGFLLNLFIAPQTQFRNEFLRDEREFSALAVSLFVLITSTPGGIGIVVGGRQADVRGRKVVAAVAAAAGATLMAASFMLAGPTMWLAAMAATIVLAPLDPIVRVYGPELFPTSLRARAAGIISTTAMAGSVVGLLAAGALADAFGSFGPAMGLLAAGPLVTAVLVRRRFPETARRTLEDLNPEDRDPEDRDPEDRDPEDRGPQDDDAPGATPDNRTATERA